jgi:hypothetical protein
MKEKISDIIESQDDAVERDFDCKYAIKDLEEQLKLPKQKRKNKLSDAEIKVEIGILEQGRKKWENEHRTPICLTQCILPQLSLVRIKNDRKETYNEYLIPEGVITDAELHNDFYLLGEINQQGGHIVVISVISGRTISMLHTYDFEVVPPQEC